MLAEVVNKYLSLYPAERKGLKLLLQQLEDSENLADRNNYRGHIAGSGAIFSPDLKKIILIYHPTFKRWMQPGGHLEPDEAGPWITAARESAEETGVKFSRQLFKKDKRIPVLLESHLVPSKPPKNEPVHYHHAFWYGFVAESEDIKIEDKVIKEVKWVAVDKVTDNNIQEVIRRLNPLLRLKA